MVIQKEEDLDLNQPRNCIAEQFIDPLQAWKLAGLPKPSEDIMNIIKQGTHLPEK